MGAAPQFLGGHTYAAEGVTAEGYPAVVTTDNPPTGAVIVDDVEETTDHITLAANGTVVAICPR